MIHAGIQLLQPGGGVRRRAFHVSMQRGLTGRLAGVTGKPKDYGLDEMKAVRLGRGSSRMASLHPGLPP
jgi:hypothetical protein